MRVQGCRVCGAVQRGQRASVQVLVVVSESTCYEFGLKTELVFASTAGRAGRGRRTCAAECMHACRNGSTAAVRCMHWTSVGGEGGRAHCETFVGRKALRAWSTGPRWMPCAAIRHPHHSQTLASHSPPASQHLHAPCLSGGTPLRLCCAQPASGAQLGYKLKAQHSSQRPLSRHRCLGGRSTRRT